jgi:predicted PurR-regulated permease PerM
MQPKTIEKYFFLGFLLVVILFVLAIFRPFFSVIILGASLAVVLHPLYVGLKHKLVKGRSWLAALITVLLFIIVLCGPLLVIGMVVFTQSQELYQSVLHGGATPFFQNISTSVNSMLPPELAFNISDKFTELVSLITANISTVFTATLNTIFGIVLTILIVFYFLKDGDDWKKSLIVMSPLADRDDEKILSKMAQAINGVIKGYIVIGMAQGVMMGIGLTIFGVPTPALWAVAAAFASLIPTLGTAIIAIPAIIYLLAIGHTAAAVGMTAWAIVAVGLIDNLLNPIIIGSRTELPPLLVLFSVLGGVALMGPVGILVGPLAISLLYALVSIYRTSFQGASTDHA